MKLNKASSLGIGMLLIGFILFIANVDGEIVKEILLIILKVVIFALYVSLALWLILSK